MPSAIGLLAAMTSAAKEGKLSGLSEAEIKTLDEVLPYMKFVKEGVGKKPTIQLSGVNLQVVNGSGSESNITGTGSGTGNLIIGYDENLVRRRGRTTSCSAGPPIPIRAMAGLLEV
jgi:hypothetical protein